MCTNTFHFLHWLLCVFINLFISSWCLIVDIWHLSVPVSAAENLPCVTGRLWNWAQLNNKVLRRFIWTCFYVTITQKFPPQPKTNKKKTCFLQSLSCTLHPCLSGRILSLHGFWQAAGSAPYCVTLLSLLTLLSSFVRSFVRSFVSSLTHLRTSQSPA